MQKSNIGSERQVPTRDAGSNYTLLHVFVWHLVVIIVSVSLQSYTSLHVSYHALIWVHVGGGQKNRNEICWTLQKCIWALCRIAITRTKHRIVCMYIFRYQRKCVVALLCSMPCPIQYQLFCELKLSVFVEEKRYPITQEMKSITKGHTRDKPKYFLLVSAFFSNTITTIATSTNTTPNGKTTTTTMITIITTLSLLQTY